jgi:tetratricopeptide (TPR) repeat protein
MAEPFSILVRAGFLFGALMALTSSAAAQTAHCFNNLSGPEVPCTARGGGYAAPVPSGPSPAEIARRRRVKAGNATNDRGIAALNRGDYVVAIREFAEAMRLWPENRNVHGNYWYAKGLLASQEHEYSRAAEHYKKSLSFQTHAKERNILLSMIKDSQRDAIDWPLNTKQEATYKAGVKAQQAKSWEAAERYFEEAHELCTKRHRIDCGDLLPPIHKVAGLKAAEQRDWDAAIREFELEKKLYGKFEFKGELNDKQDKGRGSCGYYEPSSCADRIREAQANVDRAKAEKTRRQTEDQQKAVGTRQDLQSNPNYPNPPPVYRDANTPRDYPDLASYTPAQHHAHNDNDTGNVWAQKGDWLQATFNYQKALIQDPDGPFSKVIKENLDIAMKHLKDSQPKAAGISPAPPVSATTQAKPETPKEISVSNRTGWMTANGKSSRLCMDAQAHRYCEEADGKGAVSRVSCQ